MGPRDAARGPVRTCIATREALPVDALIRFVRGPDGVVVADLKRRLPGRGVWVTATREAVAAAVQRKAFARGFKGPAAAPPDLADRIDVLLKRAALEALGMANRAGLVIAGFAQVEAALSRDPVVALVEAADGSQEGRRKLLQVLRGRFRDGAKDIPVVSGFGARELSLALGRPSVIHACLLAGPASEAFIARTSSLGRYRTSSASGGGQDGPSIETVEGKAETPSGSENA